MGVDFSNAEHCFGSEPLTFQHTDVHSKQCTYNYSELTTEFQKIDYVTFIFPFLEYTEI